MSQDKTNTTARQTLETLVLRDYRWRTELDRYEAFRLLVELAPTDALDAYYRQSHNTRSES